MSFRPHLKYCLIRAELCPLKKRSWSSNPQYVSMRAQFANKAAADGSEGLPEQGGPLSQCDCVLRQERHAKGQTHTGSRQPCEDGGRDWS